jgi:uncharacterized peroxidase-related enzyme
MKTPLVAPVEQPEDQELQSLIEFYEETLGFCPNSVLTMYHRPRIAYAFIEMNKAVMENKGRVTSALKRLIGYVCSNVAGCRYCQAHTIRAAERYGAGTDQLQHVWEYSSHPAFTEGEKVALEFAQKSAEIPNAVDEDLAERMRVYWTEGEIVEILGVVALFGYLNRWNDSMATTIESGAEESGRELLGQRGWDGGKHKR